MPVSFQYTDAPTRQVALRKYLDEASEMHNIALSTRFASYLKVPHFSQKYRFEPLSRKGSAAWIGIGVPGLRLDALLGFVTRAVIVYHI